MKTTFTQFGLKLRNDNQKDYNFLYKLGKIIHIGIGYKDFLPITDFQLEVYLAQNNEN